jgi:RHS repeat-associated protein
MARWVVSVSLFSVLTLLFLATPPTAPAQATDPTDFAQRPIPDAGHEFINLLSETVNPADGSVNLDFNLPMPKGRGVSLPFSLTYNSGALFHFHSYQPGYGEFKANSPFFSGWGTSLPYLTFTNVSSFIPYYPGDCFFSTGYEFYDPRGTGHSLQMASLSPAPYVNEPGCNNMNSGLETFEPVYSGGDSQVKAAFTETCGWGPYGTGQGQECTWAFPPVKVIDGAGSVYSFNFFNGVTNQISPSDIGGTGPGGDVQAANYPTSIEDRNGNIITFQGGNVTDTAGRAVVSMDNVISPKTVTAGGLTYTLGYPTSPANFGYSIPTYALVPPNGWVNPPGTICGWTSTVSGKLSFPTSLTLPNGKSYTFTYDPTYGVLTSIVYPDGGWVKYTWGLPTSSGETRYTENGLFAAQNQSQTYSNACNLLYQMPVVTQRQVGFGGSNPVLTQTFTYGTTWNSPTSQNNNLWTTKTTTVSTTDVVRGVTQQTVYTYSPINLPSPPGWNGGGLVAGQIPVEQEVQYYDWGNTAILRTDVKAWYDQFNLQSQQTTFGSQTSQVTLTYGFGGAVTQKNEYDFGSGAPGPLLRQTVTNYQTFPANPLITITGDSSYSTSTLLTSPCQTIVKDGNGNRQAETDYFYDNGSTGTVCGTARTPSVSAVSPALVTGTHDETNYGTSSTISRSNLTQQTEWLNAGSSPVITYNYDETGQVLSMTDPCGNPNGVCSDMTGSNHTTTYSYTDSYSSGTPSGNTNSYVTTVTDALSHANTFKYSYTDGRLTSSTDANGNPTTYKYNTPPSGCGFTDGLDRIGEVDYPDGGKTTYCYNDTSYNSATPSPSVTITKAISSTANLISTTAFDGMGHTIQTILSSDPDGTTYTVETYDGTGKPYQAYNPTRCATPTTNCGTENTWGLATYIYDSLGRVTSVLEPDGSSIATTFSNNQTTVTDEAGNQRKTQTDGLGRLTAVWEDPGSSPHLNYETDYQYDVLNNLLCAVQKGTDTTHFTTCAPAPALWRPRSFTYNSLSQLLTATNSESGTINYAYDANGNLAARVAPKAGQTGTSQTTTNYTYDAVNRLTKKAYTNPFGNVFFAYDGTILSGCPVVTPPVITSPTNLIGRRSAMCSNSGSSFSYDQMGRVQIDKRTTKGTAAKTYAISYSYNKDGSLYTLTYPSGNVVTYNVGGAGRAISVNDSSHNYLFGQPCPLIAGPFCPVEYAPFGSLFAADVGPTSLQRVFNNRLQLARQTVTAGTQTVYDRLYDFHSGTGDNGNLFGITDNVDSTRSTAFVYDPLNRIKQANTTTTTGANCWGETYTIDTWGNLYNRGAVSGMAPSCTYESLATSASTKNQLAILAYDAAGNVTNDGNGNTPTYDPENRIATDAGVTYTYDADGVRVEKSSGTMYWPGSPGVLTETDLGGTINEEYVFFNGRRIARIDRPSGTVHYYFSDHLGSAGVITDASGNVQERYFYYPYGGLQSSTGTDPNHYKFTGKERDSESNLDNFGARYDASSLGRFMTPDWSAVPSTVPYANLGDPQSLNLYSYVRNNPTSLYDPTGHCWSWTKFFCNLGERIDNLFHGEGFHTDKGVEDIAHRNNEQRRRQEVSGQHSQSAAGRAGETLGRFDRNIYDFLHQGCERGQCLVNLAPLFNPFRGRAPVPRTKVYRVWGGKSGPNGRSWTRVDPRTVPNYRDAAGLPDSNTGRFLSEGELINTEGVNATTASELDGNQGGLDELEVPNPETQIDVFTIEVLAEPF